MSEALSFQAEAQARVVAEWKAKVRTRGRSIPEWKGKTPDTPVPPHVRLRILLTWDRECYLSHRKITGIDEFELEHVISLNAGGEHREGNLRPAFGAPHKIKSAEERAEAAKIAAQAKRFHGIKSDKPKMQGPTFAPAAPQRKASRPLAKQMPPRTHVCGIPINPPELSKDLNWSMDND